MWSWSEQPQAQDQEAEIFQLGSEGRREQMSISSRPVQGHQAGGIPPSSTLLSYSGLQLMIRGPPTLGRAICCIQSTESNVNLIQNTIADVTRCVTAYLGIPWSSQLDT